MTCAHVVHVALKKVAGVESVEVSLNKGLATVKLQTGNTISVTQLWELIHKNGYTPKATAMSVRGYLTKNGGGFALKVRETNESIVLAANPKNSAAYSDAPKHLDQTVTVQGVMEPGKDLKTLAPLQVDQIK